jgi:hypothetical protein
MIAWLPLLSMAVAPPRMHIRLGSADGCDRSLTDTIDIAADGRAVWTSTDEPTHVLVLTTDELDRLAHLDRFDADHALPRDPDRRIVRLWYVVEDRGATTRLRIDSARNRALGDILFGALEREAP